MVLPLVNDLHAPSMRPRHWRYISFFLSYRYIFLSFLPVYFIHSFLPVYFFTGMSLSIFLYRYFFISSFPVYFFLSCRYTCLFFFLPVYMSFFFSYGYLFLSLFHYIFLSYVRTSLLSTVCHRKALNPHDAEFSLNDLIELNLHVHVDDVR